MKLWKVKYRQYNVVEILGEIDAPTQAEAVKRFKAQQYLIRSSETVSEKIRMEKLERLKPDEGAEEGGRV